MAADLCWSCVSTRGVAPERNDMRHDGSSGGPGLLYAFCGGCGMGYFDRDGKRVEGEPGGWLGMPTTAEAGASGSGVPYVACQACGGSGDIHRTQHRPGGSACPACDGTGLVRRSSSGTGNGDAR